MTRKYDKNYLLADPEGQAIMNCYLIKGTKEGIYLGDFVKMLKNAKTKDNMYYILLRKRINEEIEKINIDIKEYDKKLKTTIKNRLQQMKREGLLIQKEGMIKKTKDNKKQQIRIKQMKETKKMFKNKDAGLPYFLVEQWQNYPLKQIINNLVDKTPLNRISFINPTPTMHDIEQQNGEISKEYRTGDYDFWTGTILFGLNINILPESEKKKIIKNMEKAHQAMTEIDNIRDELWRSWCIGIIREKIGIDAMGKELELYLYEVLMTIAHLSIEDNDGRMPSKEQIQQKAKLCQELYHLHPHFSEIEYFIDIVKEINKKLIKLYPFDRICLSSFGMHFLKGFRDTQQYENSQLVNMRIILNKKNKDEEA